MPALIKSIWFGHSKSQFASATASTGTHTHTQDTTPPPLHFTHQNKHHSTHPRDTPTHTAASRSLSPPLRAAVVGGVVSIPPLHICSHSPTHPHTIITFNTQDCHNPRAFPSTHTHTHTVSCTQDQQEQQQPWPRVCSC